MAAVAHVVISPDVMSSSFFINYLTAHHDRKMMSMGAEINGIQKFFKVEVSE